MNTDATSLQNLNPIVWPAPPGLWPLAPGWLLLMVIVLLFVVWIGWRSWRKWLANLYRRQALGELKAIQQNRKPITQLPLLLKRTALSAFPRTDVACLSGEPWRDFLNSTQHDPAFAGRAGELLDQLAYEPGLCELNQQDRTVLLAAGENWLRTHQPPRDNPS